MIIGYINCRCFHMLDSISAGDWIQIFLLIVTIISVWVGVYNHNKQLKLSFYADYTKRYQEIILNFPENINTPEFNLDAFDDKKEKDKTMRYLRVYFDLCSEEFHLDKEDDVDKTIWKNWKAGIEFALAKPAFQQGWKIIKEDTYYYDDFKNWVNEVIEKNPPKNKI